MDDLDEGPLKSELLSCDGPFYPTDFSIGHRGAALQFPEHTRESYLAAARMGAGIIECDVTFTKDRQLVCRHSQCELHTTTNILAIPELAAKCRKPFSAAEPERDIPASAECCTSDLTVAEFKSLCVKMDASNLEQAPDFGAQAVYLDERVDTEEGYEDAVAGMEALSSQGVRIIAPPTFALVTLDGQGEIVPSSYARAAREGTTRSYPNRWATLAPWPHRGDDLRDPIPLPSRPDASTPPAVAGLRQPRRNWPHPPGSATPVSLPAAGRRPRRCAPEGDACGGSWRHLPGRHETAHSAG